ncbi:MAG: hypothetical protein Q8P00_00880, partial [Dehalococcoidia bacterium]|nr:hypothetical protein [Dehalococcoidia bacterium]
MRKHKLVITIAAITFILTLVGLGLAAMAVNPPFTVPTWLPMLFFALAGLMSIALVFYLMWELIMRIPLRFQVPIIVIKQQGKTNLGLATIATAKRLVPRRLEHDGVLWEDGGREPYATVDVRVIGPLCPK